MTAAGRVANTFARISLSSMKLPAACRLHEGTGDATGQGSIHQSAATRSPPGYNSLRLLDENVAEPVGLPRRLSGIGKLDFQLVTTAGERDVWNTLMEREHPHGMATFAGSQTHYLVGSAYG